MPWMAIPAAMGMSAQMIGEINQANLEGKALDNETTGAQQYFNTLVPDPAQQQLILQRYQSTGQMDPRLQQAFQQAKTQMSNIQTDPSLKGAQLSALGSLQDIASRGGRSLSEDADLNRIQNQVNSDNRGRIGAIQSNFAQRGMGQPGGLEMMAQLQNAQDETQRESGASLDEASQAQKNALSAIQQAGSQAGSMRNQDFGEQAQVAQAQDAINRFNTQALQSANAANTQAQNQGQLYNLENTQNISNMNTQVANQQQQYNKQLLQQQFQDQMQKNAGISNALNGVANQYNTMGNNQAQMWGNLGQGAVKAGAAYQQYQNNNPSQDDNEDTNGAYSGASAGANFGSGD